jgi:hypothetical protein
MEFAKDCVSENGQASFFNHGLNCPAELRLCPPHLGEVASRIRSSSLESLDRMMQDIAWLAPKYTQYTPDVQSFSALSGPLPTEGSGVHSHEN